MVLLLSKESDKCGIMDSSAKVVVCVCKVEAVLCGVKGQPLEWTDPVTFICVVTT
jgi:hypothetical protein